MLEYRQTQDLILDNKNSRTIKGTAIVFNSLSQLLYDNRIGNFYEIVEQGSITQDFLNSQDIVFLYNHEDTNGILARSKNGKGTLKVSVDNRGVHFSFEAKDTQLGNEILQSVKCGDLTSCSFAFQVGKDKIEKTDNKIFRYIKSFNNISDFSIVSRPAYMDTSVSSRKLKELQEKEDLTEYYKELDSRLKPDLTEYHKELDNFLKNIKGK